MFYSSSIYVHKSVYDNYTEYFAIVGIIVGQVLFCFGPVSILIALYTHRTSDNKYPKDATMLPGRMVGHNRCLKKKLEINKEIKGILVLFFRHPL